MSEKLCTTPEIAYATVPNVLFPGTQAQATAAEARAQSRQNDRWADVDGVTITVAAGAIEIET